MRPGPRALALLAPLAAAGGCDLLDGGSAGGADASVGRSDGDDPGGDAAGADAGVGADAGDRGGSAERIDVATWNIENFPRDATTTPDRVAEIIVDLELDLVAVQEVADQAAFEGLVESLDGYDHVLSFHEYSDGEYQKIGFIYRTEVLGVSGIDLLFSDVTPSCDVEGTFHDPFPRPPLEVNFDVKEPHATADYSFTAIGVHMKAYFPPDCDNDCRLRRACANRHLETHVRGLVEDAEATDNVLVLGDFNEILDNGSVNDPFAPWEGPGYEILTRSLGAADYSYVFKESLIDHALVTSAMAPAFAGDSARVIYLDRELADYTEVISDHVPVAASFDPP